MNNGKSPLYKRISNQYNNQKKSEEEMTKKNLDDVRESHKRIDMMNLFDHQHKYLEKLKAQEGEREESKKR